jgi:hypothetical protein
VIVREVRIVVIGLLAGCASGGNPGLPGDSNGQGDDAKVYLDAADTHDDAHVYHDAHVYNDAHIYNDAHVYNDAHIYTDAHVYMDACVPVQTQLLLNGNFEAGANGNWHEIQFTGSGGGELIVQHLPQAGTWNAWLGGYVGSPASDEIFEDVAVPAGTTSLVVTGYWLVGTNEVTTDTTPYDVAQVALTNTSNVVIESALSLSNANNNNNAGTYNFFTHSFATAGIAGTTVRLGIASSNDNLNATNFFFDTLTLTATHCP